MRHTQQQILINDCKHEECNYKNVQPENAQLFYCMQCSLRTKKKKMNSSVVLKENSLMLRIHTIHKLKQRL